MRRKIHDKQTKYIDGLLNCQSPGNIVSDMDGEKVMLSVDNGKYYNLGELGREIWDLMKEQILVEQLVNILISEYDVEKTECRSQVVIIFNSIIRRRFNPN